ncbi:MRN complex-interacting protein isoform X2 [Maniola jurtina]|nr:MRN complex-interacting protein isoform X2 [Maniola jurtina]
MCGEKQSVKRHYGIGTAKDCRINVQKLNNLRGGIEELKLKTTDSEDSDYETNTENVDKTNYIQGLLDNAKKESKWLAYVEKEENSVVKEPEYFNNVEVCLELPKKRKINRKSKPFKIPKVSNECNKKTQINNEIFKKLPTPKSDELNIFNHNDNCTDLNNKNNVRYQLESIKRDIKSVDFQTNKSSKWAQYIAYDTETDDQYIDIDNDENRKEHHDDNKAENCATYYQEEEKCYQLNVMDDNESKSNSKETEVHHKLVTNKLLFSLCDDSDIDNILDF